ncbi:MAG: sulfite exporter TauE/SafE family protein [Bilophila wadsworthia]
MLLTVSLLCIVTFIAGLIDSIAGGGGLLRLPALLIAGVSPQQALGTNKFTGAIGTGAAMLNFARKGLILWKLAFIGIPCALLGSAAGSKCILAFDPQTAGKILIALLPVAAMITLIPRRSKSCKDSFTSKDVYLLTPLICFSVGFYDGFFGPGAGSFFIIAFNVCLRMNLIQASALTKVFNLSSNLGSLFVFVSRRRAFSLRHPHDRGRCARQPRRQPARHPHRPDHRSPLPAPLACHFVRFPYLEVLFRGVGGMRVEWGKRDFLEKVPSSPLQTSPYLPKRLSTGGEAAREEFVPLQCCKKAREPEHFLFRLPSSVYGARLRACCPPAYIPFSSTGNAGSRDSMNTKAFGRGGGKGVETVGGLPPS